MKYRTEVQTSQNIDDVDNWPDCAGTVDPELGELTIVDSSNGVESQYLTGEWVSFTTTVVE